MVAERSRFETSQQEWLNSNPREWFEERPFASVTILFGIGFGVGLLLGHTIAESAGRRLFHEDSLSEKLTGQIRDLLRRTLPTGLARHVS